jgi:hypothetical protein
MGEKVISAFLTYLAVEEASSATGTTHLTAMSEFNVSRAIQVGLGLG